MLVQNGQLVIGNRIFGRVDLVSEEGTKPVLFYSEEIPESEIKILINEINLKPLPIKHLDLIKNLLDDEIMPDDRVDAKVLFEKIKEILEK